MAEIEPAQDVQTVTEPPVEPPKKEVVPETPKPKTVRRLTLATSVVADAAGYAAAIFTPQGAEWYVERGYLTTDSIIIPVVGLYVGLTDDMHIRDEATALRVLFDNSKPIYVRNGEDFIVQWVGCTTASNCRVTVQVRQES